MVGPAAVPGTIVLGHGGDGVAGGVGLLAVAHGGIEALLPDAVLSGEGGLQATLHLALQSLLKELLLLMEVAGDGALLLTDDTAQRVGGGGDGLGDEFFLVGTAVLLRTGLADALAEEGVHALMPAGHVGIDGSLDAERVDGTVVMLRAVDGLRCGARSEQHAEDNGHNDEVMSVHIAECFSAKIMRRGVGDKGGRAESRINELVRWLCRGEERTRRQPRAGCDGRWLMEDGRYSAFRHQPSDIKKSSHPECYNGAAAGTRGATHEPPDGLPE